MTATLVPFDDPQAYVAEDRRQALADGRPLADRVSGAAVFADVSGFTPLTEGLVAELGPQRGVEALTATLDRVFGAVLDALHAYGGSVIYFSGDAVTCWLDGDDGTRATACALAMQQEMARVGAVDLPSGAAVTLSMKVAVALGAARRFVVGDPDVQLIDVLAGALMDVLAGAEHAAGAGEVVLDASALQRLDGRVVVGERRRSADGREVGVATALREEAGAPRRPDAEPVLDEQVVRPWLLPAVYERLRTGRGEFLAELRNAVPLFLRFGGIDYDDDPRAQERLDAFVSDAQRVVHRLGGNVLQLTIGDKGSYLYAVFGSPVAHEDDAARACSAALELQALAARSSVTDVSVGLAAGRLRSGTYGSASRRTFCCLGDAVNLAARLMAAAGPGEVYASAAVAEAAGDGYDWDRRLQLQVKGKAAAIDARVLRSRARSGRGHRHHVLPLVGRDSELALLDACAAQAASGSGQVVGVCAEAGVGKSRLLLEVEQRLQRRGIPTCHGEAPSFCGAGYAGWHELWLQVLGLDGRAAPAEVAARASAELTRLAPDLLPRLPLLGAVLGVPLDDNELTASLDPKLRKESLEALVGQHLEHRVRSDGPLALVLEDGQWLDSLSRDLLSSLVRAVSRLPVLLVVAHRPPEPGDEPLLDLDRDHVREVRLRELDPSATRALATSRLATRAAAGARPSAALLTLVVERAQGNPFYVEELLAYVLGTGVDVEDEDALRRVELPETLHDLVLSRIDTLAEGPRRTVKVASVVGRAFTVPLLQGAYPELGTQDQLVDALQALQSRELVLADQEALAYLFRHIVTRDVAYASMPFAIRELLHEQVGDHLERTSADPPLDLLAHHYWHSANPAKKVDYLRRAGEAAQAAYAGAAAIDYFSRLAPLLPDDERGPVLLRLGQVRELSGAWAAAEQAYDEALQLAQAGGDRLGGARAHAALADVSRKQGRFSAAAAALEAAFSDFVALDDRVGVARVLHLGGTLAAQRGTYDEARDKYSASLEIRRQLDDKAGMAALLSNLGVVAEYEGDYPAARDLNARALELRTQVGDRWAIGVSQNNLGMVCLLEGDHAAARDCFAEAMRLHREVGDLWMVAIAHNNLGNALRGLRELESAREHFAASLAAYRSWDDRWALAVLFEDLGALAAADAEPVAALELAGAADALREALGAPRSPAQEAQLQAALAPARLADPGADPLARGRAMSLDEAATVAADLCRPHPSSARRAPAAPP
jgi:predicted ATPase/class 3 adenylate cyclase